MEPITPGAPAPAPESPAPVAAESAPAIPGISDLPEHLVPNSDQYTLEHAVLSQYSPEELAALDAQFGDHPETPAEQSAVPGVQSAQSGVVPPGNGIPAPAAPVPDPLAGVMSLIEKQSSVIAALEARLNPPAAAPKREQTATEKLLATPDNQLDEVGLFQKQVLLDARATAAEENRELREFYNQHKAQAEQAAKTARQTALANQIYSEAESQVHHLTGNIHASQLTPQDRAAYTNLILATQAATDGMSAQAAAVEARKVLDGAIQARMRTPAAVVRQPGAQPRPVAPPNPVGGQSATGGATWMPSREQIYKHYGTTPSLIAEGSAEGWKRIPRG
jgi:hypothetical protein